MTDLNKEYLWLIWAQHVETLAITSFNVWADNADEALCELEDTFYDTSTSGLRITKGSKKHEKVEKDIHFPKDRMRILKIQSFHPDAMEEMNRAREWDGNTKYVNKKKFPEN